MKHISQFKLLFIFIFSISVFGQKTLNEFEEITKEEIDLKSVPFEEDASAVILYENGYLHVFRSGYELHVKRRIKILNENAFDIGNIELLYYTPENTEKIINVSAQTINIEDNKYVNYAVDKKEIFDVKHNDDYNAVRFTFPNIKVGSIIEYQYTLRSQDFYSADPWNFQHDIPTLSSKFNAKVELYGSYTKLILGKRMKEKYKNSSKSLMNWELNDVPSIKELKYVYNVNKTAESIRLQFTKYDSYPEFRKDFEKYTTLNESEFAVKKYAETIPNSTSEIESLKAILKQFEKDFKWNKYRGIISQESQRNTLNSKVGNLADLNILLKDILKHKGIKAELVLLSSRIHGKSISSIPFIDHFDYLVNYVELKNGQNFVINAVDIPENDYRFASLNLFNDIAYLLDESKDGRFVTLNQTLSEYQTDFKYTLRNGSLSESRKDIFNGYFYDKDIKDSKILVNQYVNSPIKVYNDEETPTINYINEKYIVGQNSKMTLTTENTFIPIENPLLYYISTFTFTETDRKDNIEFNFPFYFKININVDIPSDYQIIESKDYNQTINPTTDLVYTQRNKINGNILQISYEFYLGKPVFKSENYNTLKQFFEAVQKEASKQITLKKK